MRGDRKGSEGKVSKVDRRKYRIFVEGITREKVDGSAIPVAVHPSKVMITNLNLDDKWRRESLKVEVAGEAEKPKEAAAEPKKEPRKRKPRRAPAEKAKVPKKRRVKKSTEETKGESEIG
jgi:ribosomal protein L24